MRTFSLSSQGLMALKNVELIEKFTISVGKDNYVLPKLLAIYISPVIAEKIQDNPKITKFSIPIKDDNRIFRNIMALAYGDCVTLDANSFQPMTYFGKMLGNSEIVAFCDVERMKVLANQPITFQNVVEILNSKHDLKMDVKNEIEFIAQHFSLFSHQELSQLDLKDIISVISHPSLLLETETTLFDYVMFLIKERGFHFSSLFQYILFEFLGEDEMNEFVSLFQGMPINEYIWAAISRRLIHPVCGLQDIKSRHRKLLDSYSSSSTQNKTISNKKQQIDSNVSSPVSSTVSKTPTKVIHLDGDPLHGIFSTLRSSRNTVTISSSSCNTGTLPSLLNPSNKSNYWTQNQPDSWIKVELKKHRVKPSAYTLRGRYDHDFNQLQCWVFEGMNKSKWVILDSHNNSPLPLKEPKTFEIHTDETFSSFRVRQTGDNTYGDKDLVLSAFEVFGEVY